MKIGKFVDQLLDRLFVVLGAFLGSQIPEFMQQYTQRLSGHVEELNLQLAGLRQLASHSGKTLEQYIDKFAANPDPDFSRQGEFMQGMVNRWQELSQSLNHLIQSPFWEKPFIFLKELNIPIAKAAFEGYQPGLNLSLEGLCYAGIGLVAGIITYKILSTLFKAGYGYAISFFKVQFSAK